MAENNLLIHKLFSISARRFPERRALEIRIESLWKSYTYKEIENASLRVATYLVRQGFKKQDAACLILDNCPEWTILYLGLMYAGLICVPLSPALTKQELNNLILDSGAKIIFTSREIFQKNIQPIEAGLKTKNILLETLLEVLNTAVDESILPQGSSQDVASLIYTSGTTGEPKGVLLTHSNICSNFKSIEKLNIVNSHDNLLSMLPLYHTYAFTVTLITPLFLGARVTYFNLRQNPKELVPVIKEKGVTLLVGVPQIFSLLHKGLFEKTQNIPRLFLPFLLPLIKFKIKQSFGHNLRLLVSGGARLEPEIGFDLQRLGFTLIEGYGLTETSPIVTINPPKRIKFGSVGKPIPDVQVKIIDADDKAIGEVAIKGPNVMKGYFKNEEATSGVIKDGWFYSGDLGYMDKDGYLFLTGRKKDVIVLSSGKNIFPEELEELFKKSPFIKEICILPRRLERFGASVESLFAVVVPNLEYFGQLRLKDIRGKIRWELENFSRDLPGYKHVMGFTLTTQELPRTVLGKIKRYKVIEEYLKEEPVKGEAREALSPQDSALLEKEASKKIINYLGRELKGEVSLDSHLEIDLGIDSLSAVELALGLESLLGIKISDDLLSGVSTVKELIIALSKLSEKETQPDKPQTTQKSWNQVLREPPPEAIVKKIRLKAGLGDRLFTLVFKGIFLFIFNVFWPIRIKGIKNLSLKGPCIICPNHASYLDGFTVFVSLKLKDSLDTFFLGYSDIFEQPLARWAIKPARLIPIDPNTHLTEAMQAVSFVLRQGKIVCIFPEGRRAIDENVGEFRKGVSILLKELDIPVIPVYIKDAHKAWGRMNPFPRPYPLKIIFGKPKSYSELRAKGKDFSDDYQAIAWALREEVIALSCSNI